MVYDIDKSLKRQVQFTQGDLQKEKRADVWIFGYGSLIWNPGFTFKKRQVGFIQGWSRRFYQGSIDHRGTPGTPGRVATLVAEPEATCWGIAYHISEYVAESVFSYLDHREKGGFERHLESFHPVHSARSSFAHQVIVYVARHDNPNYLGPATLTEMALQIFNSSGPSGPNVEYLIMLANSLRSLGVVDEHVFELEQHVHALAR